MIEDIFQILTSLHALISSNISLRLNLADSRMYTRFAFQRKVYQFKSTSVRSHFSPSGVRTHWTNCGRLPSSSGDICYPLYRRLVSSPSRPRNSDKSPFGGLQTECQEIIVDTCSKTFNSSE